MRKLTSILPNRLLFSALFIGLLFNSCSKSPKCWGDDKNKGIINSSIRIDCFPEGEEFVISNDSTYVELFSSDCHLPEIDFQENTLLGLYAKGTCEIKTIREVTQNESEKKYHYKVTVKSCGSCKKLSVSYNWVLVPKLPDGWTVAFETVEK